MLRRALSIAAFAPQVKPNPHRSPLTTHLSPFTLTLTLTITPTLTLTPTRIAFAPQLLLLGLLALCFGRDLPFCLFVQTLLFVSLNKVCTAHNSS